MHDITRYQTQPAADKLKAWPSAWHLSTARQRQVEVPASHHMLPRCRDVRTIRTSLHVPSLLACC